VRSRPPIALLTALLLASCTSYDAADTVEDVHPNRLVIVGADALVGPDLKPASGISIAVEDGSITAVGPDGDVPVPTGSLRIDGAGLTLIPGFIDSHVHVGFHPPQESVAGGVTTVRDLGWPPERIFPLVERSRSADFDGPTILAAGPIVTVPGGYPEKAGWAPPGTGAPIESEEEAEAVVESARRAGASVIKVALDPPAGPTLSNELLRAVVEAAHERKLKVTAHIHGLSELRKAVTAGVDELAHMLMSSEEIPDDLIAEMVGRGMTVVPTLSIRSGRDRATAIGNLRRFRAAGGRVVYGTDLGNGGPQPGIDPLEIQAMQEAGMAVADIVRSATIGAARWIGLEHVGALRPGWRADIVGVRGDLAEGTDVLSAVDLVIKGGRVIRGGDG
jgi:imidazolonepropionase-like amidohydrolase